MRKKIGIITGSGPEAGIDLWQKILKVNKEFFKEKFRGDLDAPNVTIFSVPELGYSMELEKNYDIVWEALKKTVEEIIKHVDYFVIACNTLNVFANKIEELGYKDKFISTLDVVNEYIEVNSLKKISIVGALPVLKMDEYSVFKPLYEKFDIELPKDFKKVQKLIYDVKKYGATSHSVTNQFRNIVFNLESEYIFLACTELPLIILNQKSKNLIDVTLLLARKLIAKSF